MSKESIYISIPITGHDEAVQRTKSGQISTMLYEMGYDTVINPLDVYDAWKNVYKREPTYDEIMQADIAELLKCTAIYMCNGWSKSLGCMKERQTAINAGLEVIYEYGY